MIVDIKSQKQLAENMAATLIQNQNGMSINSVIQFLT